ncbi:hypothetical protein HMPREF9074_09387 [Capnocytophaga sp. oral taxon 329 str. F0087]|nr:hypothetical protein HMPREF9074_09387 [Capnocytophaga sp. oral taxon 329 str. F0087]
MIISNYRLFCRKDIKLFLSISIQILHLPPSLLSPPSLLILKKITHYRNNTG